MIPGLAVQPAHAEPRASVEPPVIPAPAEQWASAAESALLDFVEPLAQPGRVEQLVVQGHVEH